MTPPHDNPAIAAAFLDRYLADVEGGGAQTLEEYQALFPGHDALIAREFAQVERDDDHPDRIAHYEIRHELGRGGQGRVYLAHDTNLGRDVALKILPDHGALSAKALARFRREAETAARLDHPGICTVLDTGRSDGIVYIAMRYIDGESLAARNRSVSPIEVESRGSILGMTRLFERIARAVHAAHEADIIHRDLKPGNIMCTSGGDPVVLDFGLARDEGDDSDASARLTRTGEVFGTPFYMSPEQLRGAVRIDRRTDVYALGASLYECLTLHPPIEADSREALYAAILEQPPHDPKRHNRAIPRDLCSVLTIALEKDRDRRYATAEAFAEDLRRVAAYEPIIAQPPGPATRAWRWVQRNRVVASLAAALFVALTAALGISLWFLSEAEAALDDIRAGRESKREQEIEAKLLEGYHVLYSADPRLAPELLEDVLALDPQNLDAIAARVWLGIEDPDASLQVLDRIAAAAQLTEHPDIVWLRGFVLAAAQRSAEADEHFARAGDAENSMRLYFRGLKAAGGFRIPVGAEQQAKAQRLFERAALRAPRPRFHHHHSLLMNASFLQNRETMERHAADLEYHWPDAPATHDAIAQFFMPVDKARALRSLERLTKITKSAAPYCGLAYAAVMDGDLDAALQHFDRGIQVDPGFAVTWFMRAELKMQRGDAEGARRDYLESVRRDARNGLAFAGLQRAHDAIGDRAVERSDVAALTRDVPDAPFAWLALARIEARDGYAAAAANAYERAARATPVSVEALRGLETLAGMHADVAVEACARITARHPDSLEAFRGVARVREAAGDLDGAIAAWERALEIHPGHSECEARLAACRARR